MFEDIGNDKWQVALCHDLFFVAKFDDAVSDSFDILFGNFYSESFKILADIGFA